MSTRKKTRPSRAIRTALPVAMACALLAVPTSSVAAETGITPISPSASTPTDHRVTLPASIIDADGPVSVFIQTVGDSALEAQQATIDAGSSDTRAETVAADVAEENEVVTDAVGAQLAEDDPDVEVLYSSAYSVPGIAVSTDVEALQEIAERDDVVKISPIVMRTLDLPDQTVDPANAASDALSRAVDAWQQTGNTGKDVTVAVIDTGLDYTHATFGGPSTTASYSAALASTGVPDPSWYDATKYVGGWDFAGTTYNGAQGTSAYDPVPDPDPNPIDGAGGNHGTHVAGTAVGFGVTADGTTYRGGYSELSSEAVASEFSVGPGSAPEADVMALKIFGDGGGSTALTGAALEWIAEQIASGTQIDVVNMSIGSDYGAVDDPENAKLEVLMDAGVLPVVAAGNAGDVTDVSGSPGNTARALTVAASSSGSGFGDAIYSYIGDPNRVEPGTHLAQYSQNYWATDFSVTKRVRALRDTSNLDGCDTFSAEDAAWITGKFVWLEWDDEDVACGSATRFENAQAAGAVGVLVESQSNGWETGIAGNETLPGAQLSLDAVTALRPSLDADTLTMRLDSDGKASIEYSDASRIDTLASFSSRGVHGSVLGTLKPDVAAPGVSVMSAANGTGSGGTQMSGTSMATPHVAGIAALVKQSHPSWGPDRIKQQIMNTAFTDISTGGSDSVPYGPARAGTGRVDALSAVTSSTTIGSVENSTLVSASFGVVEVGEDTYTATRTIRIENEASVSRELTLAYLPRTETPGVSYELGDDSIVLGAGASADVTLTLRVDDPAALRRTLDQTMSAMQGGLPRQYVSDASGYVTVTGTDGAPPIRLSVYAAPKPVSDMSVTDVTFADDEGTLSAAGRPLDQGEGSESYRSMMVPLILGTTDPDDSFPENAATSTLESVDLLAVGASSTAPQVADPSEGILTIGIETDGEWARMSPLSYPMVQLDLNGDTRSDFAIVLQPGGDGDAPLAITIDVVTGETVDERPVNGLFADQGTNVFDNNVLTMSTGLAELGFTPATTQTTVRYIVQTRSYYAPAYDNTYKGTLVDATSASTIDVYDPLYWFGSAGTEAATFSDTTGTLPVHRSGATDAEILVLHLHNGAEERAQIVVPTDESGTDPDPGATPTPTAAPTTPASGDDPSVDDPSGDGETLARTGMVGSLLTVGLLGAALVALGVLARIRRSRRTADPAID